MSHCSNYLFNSSQLFPLISSTSLPVLSGCLVYILCFKLSRWCPARGMGFYKFTLCFHFGMPETAKKGIEKIPYSESKFDCFC